MTNLDRIRAMTAEELAEFLDKVTGCCAGIDSTDCDNCPLYKGRGCCENSIAEWLESEVSENENC